MTTPGNYFRVKEEATGTDVASHEVGGKEFQVMLPATEHGHIHGSVPTFFALTPISAFAASAFQWVLFNNNSAGKVVKLLKLVFLPEKAALVGVLPGAWTLRRRETPTTAPAGGDITPVSADSGDSLPANISAHGLPTTAPAGGTPKDILTFCPQPDELKLTTLDAPTMMSLQPFGGQTIYDAYVLAPGKPLYLRQNQTLELQQDATAGTGNCRILGIFTVEG